MANNEPGFKMSIYDINKAAYLQVPALTQEQIEEKINFINTFMDERSPDKFHMLLCHDIDYYTIFTELVLAPFPSLGAAVLECASDVGEIVDVIEANQPNAIEIWVKTDKEAYCMYLFGCDPLVVYYAG